MSAQVAAEVARLRVEVEALTAGLTNMVATQEAQTTMLTQVLTALTAEPGESPVAALLADLIAQISQQTAVLLRIEAAHAADATVQH